MKKTIIILCSVVVSVAIVSLLIYRYNFSYNAIEEDYYSLVDAINSKNISNSEKYSELSKIFKRISKGKKSDQDEFAKLLRIITNDSIYFDDAEIFDTAKALSEFYDELANGNDTSGIESIALIHKNDNTYISLDYINVKKYTINTLSANEKEIYGDRDVEYDGKLGEYRLQITFFDSKPSDKFANKYKSGSVYEMKGTNNKHSVKFKWVHSADHGFVIYIGSDEPFGVSEDTIVTTRFKGTIYVNLN